MTAQSVTSYRELVEGIKAQVAAMQVSYMDFDDLAGFPSGLAGKIFGPAQVKRLGAQKMFDAIRAAGLKLALEVDEKQVERMRRQIATKGIRPRNLANVRTGHSSPVSIEQMQRVLKQFAKMGVQARMEKIPPEKRSGIAKHAAKKRWRREFKRRARQRKQTHKARKGRP